MITLRTAAQQALEALEEYQSKGAPFLACDGAVAALRAALAQQKDPTDPGNDVDVLREHVRHLERRVRELHAQQAEPVAGVVLNEEGRAALVEHGREEWHCVSRNARRLYTAPPQCKQAEPLNLSDPAVQKRLASQWGYVPAAAQAEPVEPVAWNWMLDGLPYGRACYGDPPDADIAERAATAGRTVRLLYTAPPQCTMVPLTEKEIMHIGMTHQSLRQVVRAVERAHGIKE